MSKLMTTNFRDSFQVVAELKNAFIRYNDYQVSFKGGDNDQAVVFLKEAGQLAYAAMEHAYKNYLYHYYNKQYDEKKIDDLNF